MVAEIDWLGEHFLIRLDHFPRINARVVPMKVLAVSFASCAIVSAGSAGG
jgi:hypothetical protein